MSSHIIYPRMKGRGLGLRSLDWMDYAVFVQQVDWVTKNILYLSAPSCNASGKNGPIYLVSHSCTTRHLNWQTRLTAVSDRVSTGHACQVL